MMPDQLKTMRAVLLKGHGGFDQLEYREDVPVPVPRDGEVLIKVGAAGINNTDINTRVGWYAKTTGGDASWTGAALEFPRIQGIDAAGEVVAVGRCVDPARIGERVLVEPAFRKTGADISEAIYFGSECDGAFAEFARVPAIHAHAISCNLTVVELASFPCSYSTAENMLQRAGVLAGETVLVTGASGGVGSAAVQLARRRGAKVVALASTGKREQVMALGATQVLPRDGDLSALLGPDCVDVVIDVVGGPAFAQLLDLIKRGGRYAVAGAIAGPVVELDLRTLYLKDLTLLGCTVLGPQVFPNLVGYISRGEIRPVVASIHSLRNIVDAQREFLEKRHTGKIVLVP